MFRSATLRLTLWYLAIAMAISLLFSFVLYHVTTSELSRDLHAQSQSLYQQFPVFENDPSVSFKPGNFYSHSDHRILLRLVGFNLIVLITAGFSSYLLARRTLEPIEAAHGQQKRFTADVSHELRTPLTAIKMESEVALLNDQTPADELRRTLSSNLEEVNKLEDLINSLLRLSQLEADELQQNFIAVSSRDIVNTAVENVSANAKLRDIKIESKANKAAALGDRDSLVQLLTILLDNAIKYSPRNSVIEVIGSSSRNQVTWRVIDHGIGIEQSALEHIFDRFYRSDASRNKSGSEGFGLGLSIAKMIADVHGANITLTSQPNQGTTASISIDRANTLEKPAAKALENAN